ncbi:NAD(P)-dependent oxidoreductase [Micrococcoides hystricis]|uniref:NAD(P)-dependent oxidoreductase n=1 Tax=Micrococcoides hystricis TaxID=1572761 RepID=A0ABV6PAS8_9MICC
MKHITMVALPDPAAENFTFDFGPALTHENLTLLSWQQARTAETKPNALLVYWGTKPADVKSVLDEFDSIEWVQLPSAGIESYQEAMTAHPDRVWTTAKGSFAKPVGEHALALTLALLRDLPDRVRATTWGPQGGQTLNGMKVVITGAGGVSQEILRLIKMFDTEVTIVRRSDAPVPGADRTVSFDQFGSVLEDADVLILGSALTAETKNMLGAAEFARMQPSSVVVNIARGGVIDTDALVDALDAGQIKGAGLDVTAPEPLPDGHPLWAMDNVIITPHSADTRDMIRTPMQDRIRANITAFAEGTDFEGVANAELGY